MKKRILFLMCCMLIVSSEVLGCEACGGGAGTMGIGLLNNYKSNVLRIGYHHTFFRSTPAHEVITTDKFSVVDISARIALDKLKRLKVETLIPYRINNRRSKYENSTVKGISDTQVILNYALSNIQDDIIEKSLFIEVGLGMNIPTGKYNKDIHDSNLPENFNVGRGNVGFLAKTNIVFRRSSLGILVNGLYQVNTKSNSGYKYGNQSTVQILGFKDLYLKEMTIIPSVGISFENVNNDIYSNKKEVLETGSVDCSISSAISIKYKRVMAGASFALPILQDYADKSVTTNGRLSFQLSYLF